MTETDGEDCGAAVWADRRIRVNARPRRLVTALAGREDSGWVSIQLVGASFG